MHQRSEDFLEDDDTLSRLEGALPVTAQASGTRKRRREDGDEKLAPVATSGSLFYDFSAPFSPLPDVGVTGLDRPLADLLPATPSVSHPPAYYPAQNFTAAAPPPLTLSYPTRLPVPSAPFATFGPSNSYLPQAQGYTASSASPGYYLYTPTPQNSFYPHSAAQPPFPIAYPGTPARFDTSSGFLSSAYTASSPSLGYDSYPATPQHPLSPYPGPTTYQPPLGALPFTDQPFSGPAPVATSTENSDGLPESKEFTPPGFNAEQRAEFLALASGTKKTWIQFFKSSKENDKIIFRELNLTQLLALACKGGRPRLYAARDHFNDLTKIGFTNQQIVDIIISCPMKPKLIVDSRPSKIPYDEEIRNKIVQQAQIQQNNRQFAAWLRNPASAPSAPAPQRGGRRRRREELDREVERFTRPRVSADDFPVDDQLCVLDTMKGGDNILHAILGKWDIGAKSVCCSKPEIEAAIDKLKEAIEQLAAQQEAGEDNPELRAICQTAITQLFADQQSKELQGTQPPSHADAPQRLETDGSQRPASTSLFSSSSFFSPAASRVSQPPALGAPGLMPSLTQEHFPPEMQRCYEQYYEQYKAHAGLIDVRATKSAVLCDYATFIGRSSQWLLPGALPLIAKVADITIECYPKGGTQPFVSYNAGKVVARIEVDGVGGYARCFSAQESLVFRFANGTTSAGELMSSVEKIKSHQLGLSVQSMELLLKSPLGLKSLQLIDKFAASFFKKYKVQPRIITALLLSGQVRQIFLDHLKNRYCRLDPRIKEEISSQVTALVTQMDGIETEAMTPISPLGPYQPEELAAIQTELAQFLKTAAPSRLEGLSLPTPLPLLTPRTPEDALPISSAGTAEIISPEEKKRAPKASAPEPEEAKAIDSGLLATIKEGLGEDARQTLVTEAGFNDEQLWRIFKYNKPPKHFNTNKLPRNFKAKLNILLDYCQKEDNDLLLTPDDLADILGRPGGNKSLASLMKHYNHSELIRLGFDQDDFLRMVKKPSGSHNLEMLVKRWADVETLLAKEIGIDKKKFKKDQIVDILSHIGGSRNLQILLNNIGELKQLNDCGFGPADIISVLDHDGGSHNFETLLANLNIIQEKKISPADFIKLLSHCGGHKSFTQLLKYWDKLPELARHGFGLGKILTILSHGGGSINFETLWANRGKLDELKRKGFRADMLTSILNQNSGHRSLQAIIDNLPLLMEQLKLKPSQIAKFARGGAVAKIDFLSKHQEAIARSKFPTHLLVDILCLNKSARQELSARLSAQFQAMPPTEGPGKLLGELFVLDSDTDSSTIKIDLGIIATDIRNWLKELSSQSSEFRLSSSRDTLLASPRGAREVAVPAPPEPSMVSMADEEEDATSVLVPS